MGVRLEGSWEVKESIRIAVESEFKGWVVGSFDCNGCSSGCPDCVGLDVVSVLSGCLYLSWRRSTDTTVPGNARIRAMKANLLVELRFKNQVKNGMGFLGFDSSFVESALSSTSLAAPISMYWSASSPVTVTTLPLGIILGRLGLTSCWSRRNLIFTILTFSMQVWQVTDHAYRLWSMKEFLKQN